MSNTKNPDALRQGSVFLQHVIIQYSPLRSSIDTDHI